VEEEADEMIRNKHLSLLFCLGAVVSAGAPGAAQNSDRQQRSFESDGPCTLIDGKKARPPSMRGFFLGGMRFRPQHVKSVQSDFDEFSAEPVVVITFAKQAANRLKHLTAKMVGQTMPMFLDGALLACPIVNEPISGGEIQISGGFSAAEAQMLAAKLRRIAT
jgi:preprotein translocase subunit SecD